MRNKTVQARRNSYIWIERLRSNSINLFLIGYLHLQQTDTISPECGNSCFYNMVKDMVLLMQLIFFLPK